VPQPDAKLEQLFRRDVAKVLAPLYARWDTSTHQDLLARFDLPADRPIKSLSRGTKLKLMLAVALSHDATLLILDEPTSGLDPVARDELLEVLREYVADGQRSVFFSTHITSDLEKVADDIALIHHGRVFFAGTVPDLLDGFVVARGSTDALTDELRDHLVGLTKEPQGFSGLLPTAQSGLLGQGATSSRPDIDEILVYVAKEDRQRG
jgi:ABC-2 type transport system ATP-binding protein